MASLFDTSTSRHLENEPPVRRVNISFPCPKKTEVMWWSQTKILTEANLHKQFNFTVISFFEYVPFYFKPFFVTKKFQSVKLQFWQIKALKSEFWLENSFKMSYYLKKDCLDIGHCTLKGNVGSFGFINQRKV